MPSYALKYVKDKGIISESKYPYTARDEKCKVQGGEYHINRVIATLTINCDTLRKDVQTQPTSVAVDAKNW